MMTAFRPLTSLLPESVAPELLFIETTWASLVSYGLTIQHSGQALRLAALSVSRSRHSLGAFYLRMRARFGPQSAMVATAHTLTRLVYHLRTHRTPFRDLSATAYERRTRDRNIVARRKKATGLGFTPVESPA